MVWMINQVLFVGTVTVSERVWEFVNLKLAHFWEQTDDIVDVAVIFFLTHGGIISLSSEKGVTVLEKNNNYLNKPDDQQR